MREQVQDVVNLQKKNSDAEKKNKELNELYPNTLNQPYVTLGVPLRAPN